MEVENVFIPVILSGGTGTRLWPVSREMHPKPFIHLSDGQSLLQKTINRVIKIKNIPEVLTVTNRELYFKTKDEYAILTQFQEKISYMLEPFGRNTAPAIALSALYALDKYGPESVLLVLPADHVIQEQSLFDNVIAEAYELAKQNKIVLLGIKPSAPETQFGYIKYEKCTQKSLYGNIYKVAEFTEKPNKKTAERYILSNQYLWNSGIFCFKVETILSEFKRLIPDLLANIEMCWQASKDNKSYSNTIEIDEKTFGAVESCSIDYAIMEKAENVVVIPCNFTWSDLGSWDSMSKLIPPDHLTGNQTIGDAILIDSTNSFIQSQDRLVAGLGINNLMIVDTPDAILVSHRDYAQEVKKIVDVLKNKDHQSYKNHLTFYRPWGASITLEENEYFKVKRLVVKPGASLSLQMHYHRSEHWIVVSGTAKVTNGVLTLILNINESTFIPAEYPHRLENIGLNDLVIIEVQTGSYFGEDDIVRFEDIYGRVPEKHTV